MKNITTELGVGLFMIAGFLAFVYLSLQMGEFSVFAANRYYSLEAEFGNISGLKEGARVEIAGVNVGKVGHISLSEADRAKVEILVSREVRVTDDAIASIRTQGIIGDKFIKIIPGGSPEFLENGGVIFDTESALDIEELVSKYIFKAEE